jgi:hypothetical protein
MPIDPTVPCGGVASDPEIWRYPDGSLVYPNGYPGTPAPFPPVTGTPGFTGGGQAGLTGDDVVAVGPAFRQAGDIAGAGSAAVQAQSASAMEFTEPAALGGLLPAVVDRGEPTVAVDESAAAPHGQTSAPSTNGSFWTAAFLYDLDLGLPAHSHWDFI